MLNTLRSIVQDVAGAGSFREQLDLLVHDVRVALGTEVCSIYLMNRDQDQLLFAANEGYLDDIDASKVMSFEAALQSYMKSSQAELMESINSDPSYTDEVVAKLKTACDDFKANHSW